MRKPIWWSAAFVMAAGCASQEDTTEHLETPLHVGDAEWERPPFQPPGGQGVAPEEGAGEYDSGGVGGEEEGGDDDGVAEPPDQGSSGSSSSSGGLSGSADGGSSSTDTDFGTSEGTAGSTEDGTGTWETSGESSTGDASGSSVESNTGSGSTGEDPVDPSLPMCAEDRGPAVIYMSNDDSNSQASPVLARQAIMAGFPVDPFRVRIHEFLNYYDLSYENPTDRPAQAGLQMRRTNAETGEFVLLAYAQGRRLAPRDREAMNVVFSLDTSGSMSGPPIARLRDTARAVAGQLREGDIVSMVTWNTSQNVLLEGHTVSGPADPVLVDLIDGLDADGGTDLNAGLVTAYALAQASFSKDRINRVVLISDGGANAGVTDLELIAANAQDSDDEGIYLVGVGVGDPYNYRDGLMDAVTDAGKGAYIFIDTEEEAQRMFGERFIQNMDVIARNVRMELTLPWYFAITEFHGEEYSTVAEEVEPQHLSPNDAMSYHQIIGACDPQRILATDRVKAKITYEDPVSRTPQEDQLELDIGELTNRDASALYKGDVIVGYAKSLIVIGDFVARGRISEARRVATDMVAWLAAAEQTLGDAEVGEMRTLMETYAQNLLH